MAEPLVPDALWVLIAPLLPERPPRPKGGRPPVDDRKALEGIVFVLRTGIPWASLPTAMGCGSGMTCWRRLRDWQAAKVFERLHRALLDRLGRANAIDFGRCSLDSASFPAKRGASAPARTRPTAAGRAASGTSWSTPAASRSRSCSARRTCTTAASSSP
jgi:transposase